MAPLRIAAVKAATHTVSQSQFGQCAAETATRLRAAWTTTPGRCCNGHPLAGCQDNSAQNPDHVYSTSLFWLKPVFAHSVAFFSRACRSRGHWPPLGLRPSRRRLTQSHSLSSASALLKGPPACGLPGQQRQGAAEMATRLRAARTTAPRILTACISHFSAQTSFYS